MEQQLLIYTNGSLSNFINFYGFLPSSKLKRKLFIIQIFQIIKKNHVKNFFDRKGKLKSSLKIMQEQNIKKNFYFKWCQLIYQSLNRGRNKWKEKLSKPYLLKSSFTKKQPNTFRWQAWCERTFFFFNICKKYCDSLAKKILDLVFKWKDVYTFPRIVTFNVLLRTFLYKIQNNVLYLIEHLFIFQKMRH